MIFVTVGTHVKFTRLVKHIDLTAPEVKDKIIIQKGSTNYDPKNCESFQWSPSLDNYMNKARLIISHGGLSCLEGLKKFNKPTIIVPRQYKYKEHINDHQVEFAEEIEKRYGVKIIYNISDLTPELLNSYRKIVKIDDKNLKRLQSYLKKIINFIDKAN